MNEILMPPEEEQVSIARDNPKLASMVKRIDGLISLILV